MKIEIDVPDYSRERGVAYRWELDSIVGSALSNQGLLISANRAGLISLATHLLTLAQEHVPINYDILYGDWGALEKGSYPMRVRKIEVHADGFPHLPNQQDRTLTRHIRDRLSRGAANHVEGEAEERCAEICREIFQKEWLNSVIFVMDYVQFTFNGPILSAFVHPTVEVDGNIWRWNDVGYRDALCDLITHSITETVICKDDTIKLVFDTGDIIRISLKPEDKMGPEAAMFMVNLPDDKRWWVL